MAAQSSRQPGKIKTSVNNFRCCCCFFFYAEDQNYDKRTDFFQAPQTRQKKNNDSIIKWRIFPGNILSTLSNKEFVNLDFVEDFVYKKNFFIYVEFTTFLMHIACNSTDGA